MDPRRVIPVDDGWHFKAADKDDGSYLPVSRFPTNVHLDLLYHKLIPDPFVAKNELEVQWVGERAWVYKTTFTSPLLKRGATTVLAFDGLDTFAVVELNGSKILETDNMFIPERVDISKDLLAEGAINKLVITFQSASLCGWKLVESHPDHKWGCWNGDISRTAVRKAQYHWGWDWAPALLTCGPWRPITLEIYESRISDLYADIYVNPDLKSANVATHVAIDGNASQVRFELFLRGNSIASEVINAFQEPSVAFLVQNPELWYPIRYGEQPLYTLKATLLNGGVEIDSLSKRVGLRRVELIQRPLKDQPGTSFFFQINNIPIFCGGSDWVPADSFTPRVSKKRYYDWIKLVAEGNQVMIRVWGGGIYEEQVFYDACDEFGILVWQDFMFGCANYPCWPEMLKSIEREARENVKLLRHHPCLVLWAGNNEDYQFQESESLTYDFDNKDADSWLKTDFPARYIYEKILPDVCNDLTPRTPYHPGSPWGAGRNTSDPTVGDLHQWKVWHGTQERYQTFDTLIGRFVSEFGMEAFPSVKTIDSFLLKGRDDPDRYPQSSTLDFHNKADGQERRIALYLTENLRYALDPLEYFVYCTQLMQAECLATAYRLWKREWRGPGKENCSGALVWQTNDCWPVTSWAICDYYLRPKHAYYAIKREMSILTVGMIRRRGEDLSNKYTQVDRITQTQMEIWASNLTLKELVVDCIVKAWDIRTGKEICSETVSSGIILPANRSTEVIVRDVPVNKTNSGLENFTVVAVYLYQKGRQLARYVNWPEPLKYLHLQKPKQLTLEITKDRMAVDIKAEVPIKGLALECEDSDVTFDDNLIDIVPGETVSVGIRGAIESTRIVSQYLGMQI